jgi:hypothetical protein
MHAIREFHRQAIRLVIVAALLALATPPDALARQRTPPAVDAVPKIALIPALEAVVQKMLQRSPTFRAQWQTLAAHPELHIAVRIGAQLQPYRARTVVCRYEHGLIVAVIELPPADNRVELIAHEFEHIIEQLEGMNLRRLARDSSAGVYDLGYGYETERAFRIGRQVARECRGSNPRGLKQ